MLAFPETQWKVGPHEKINCPDLELICVFDREIVFAGKLWTLSLLKPSWKNVSYLVEPSHMDSKISWGVFASILTEVVRASQQLRC